jgi:hypothetical protein
MSGDQKSKLKHKLIHGNLEMCNTMPVRDVIYPEICVVRNAARKHISLYFVHYSIQNTTKLSAKNGAKILALKNTFLLKKCNQKVHKN